MAADLGTGFINVLPRTFAFGPQLIAKTKPALDALERATGLTFSAAELAGVAAFAGLSAASISLAKNFETAMSRVEGLVGLTHSETEQLSQDILNLATQVPVAPEELANALYFIESAGLRGQEALDALTYSAKAAAAGLGSTKEVADVVTSAMNSYAQSGLTAAQATDILIAAVREGKTDPATFAKNIGQVLPIASQLGISFDQVAAAIASSTREGLQAGRAATGIRYLLGALIRPSDQATDALSSVGFSLDSLDRSLRVKGLLPTMQELAKRFDLSTSAGRKLFSTVVGGIRGMSTAAILVGENGKAVEQIFDNIANSAGSLNIAFGVASENLGFKVAQLVSDLKVLGIEWGQQLLPVAKDFINVLTVLTHVIEPIAPHFGAIATTIAGLYIAGKVGTVMVKLGESLTGVAVAQEAEVIAAGSAATGIELEGIAAAQAAGEIELFGVSEEVSTVATANLGTTAGTTGALLTRLGGSLAGSQLALAGYAAIAYQAYKSITFLATSNQDLADKFQVSTEAVDLINGRVESTVPKWHALFGVLGSVDPFGRVSAEKDKYIQAFTDISTAATDAGVSQDVIMQALQNTAGTIDMANASVDDFSNAFQGQITALQSVYLATGGYISAQERAAAVNATTGQSVEKYIASLSKHGGVLEDVYAGTVAGASALDNYDRYMRSGAQAVAENTQALHDHGSILDETSQAYKNLSGQEQLLVDYGKQITEGYRQVGPLFEAMGTDMASFQASARTALETGKWEDFASSVMDDAAQAISDFHDTAVENLSFVDDQLSELGDHPTAEGIISAFRDAGAQTKSFAGDLNEIRDVLGGRGKSLATFFLETGNAAAAAAIASASPEQQREAVRGYAKQQGAVEKLATTLTSHLLPTLRDIRELLEALEGSYNAELNLHDGVTGPLNTLEAHLRTIDGNVYSVSVNEIHRVVGPGAGGDPGDSGPGQFGSGFKDGTALGGIIRGATGFIARHPTYLVGEGLYPTPAGRGAEAVIPLGQRGMDILATAIKKGTGDSLIVAMLDALHQFNVQRDLVTEVGTKRAINIFADMERTLRRTGQLDLSEAYEVFRKSTTATEANSWRGLQRDAFRDLAGRQVWGQGIRDLRGAVSSFATKKEADDLILQLKQHYRKTGEFGYRRVKDTLKGEVSDKEMHRILNRIHDQLDEQNKRERDRDRRPEPVRHLRLTKDSDAYVETKARKAVTGRLVDQRLGREMTRRSS